MRFIRTSKVGTDTFSQLASGQQAIKFDHVALGMHPFGFDGIEPGALCGQQEGQKPNAVAGLLDLLVVLTDPGAHGLALMPGGVIPDQEPVGLALFKQTFTAPTGYATRCKQESGDVESGSRWGANHFVSY